MGDLHLEFDTAPRGQTIRQTADSVHTTQMLRKSQLLS